MSEERYHAIATRDGGWWVIDVPELEVTTQARRVDQIEHMATDLIAAWLDIEYDAVHVDLEVRIPDNWQREVDHARQLGEAAERAKEAASAEVRKVAHHLRAQGLTVRDVGVVLGVSPQRVSQLLTDRHATPGRKGRKDSAA